MNLDNSQLIIKNKLDKPLRIEERFHSLMSTGISSSESKSTTDVDALGNRFECNICLDDVREPIVTQCGHLFCWLIMKHI